MARTHLPPILALLIASTGGCQARRDPVDTAAPAPPPKARPVAATTAAPTTAGADAYFGSGEAPAAVVLVTGQLNGYLEPCGCNDVQSGGLGRRLDLIQRVGRDDRPVVRVDLGSLIDDPSKSRGGPDQVRIKLIIALRALKEMGYAAIALSADDLRIGPGEFFGLLMNMEGAPPLVAANVTPAAGLETALKQSVVVEAGSRRVGITAVIDPRSLEELPDADELHVVLTEVADPAESLGPVVAELEATTDVQVLLVQGTVELARSLAERFPGFEAVVARSVYVDPPTKQPKVEPGKPFLAQVGQKGQNVGLIGLPRAKSQPIRYRDVRLDAKYQNVEPIKSLVDQEYASELGSADVLSSFTRRPHPNGARFVGAESCKACHPKTFEKWSKTKHAQMAYHALETGPRGNRTTDAECVSCHTTGFAFEGGFVTAEKTPWLKNQQCENCHGPSSKHVGDPMNAAYRAEIALKAEEVDRTGLCVRCHDPDNDPHWDFKVRWPQVAHTDLDRYDDPKVKEGLDVEAILRALTEPAATGD